MCTILCDSVTAFICTYTTQGFAFISYDSKENAQKSIDSLNGYGYDHLILKVEWAK